MMSEYLYYCRMNPGSIPSPVWPAPSRPKRTRTLLTTCKAFPGPALKSLRPARER